MQYNRGRLPIAETRYFYEHYRVAGTESLCYSFSIVGNDVVSGTESNDELRWFGLQERANETKICRATTLLRKAGIEPVLIKGWAAARNYPLDKPRFYSDIDMAVSASDFERAGQLIKSDEFSGIRLDLHRELRYLDTVPWADLIARSELVRLDGSDVRVLCPEDHLRVLCVHWLVDGGARRERLWDIYYAVANRPAGFDWHQCLDVVRKRRRTWIIYAIGMAHRYLGLDIAGLPFEDEAKRIPAWMIRCVEKEWRSGVLLQPVVTALGRPAELVSQLSKRLPPNPIRCTIEMEGKLDGNLRSFYQLATMIKMIPSLALAIRELVYRLWRR